HLAIDTFEEWEVHGRLRLFADLVQGVADHTNDFVINLVGCSSVEMRRNMQVLADRIVPVEIFPDELPAHNHLVRSGATFVVCKEPTAHQGDSESAEIAWIGPAHQRLGPIFTWHEGRMLLHRKYKVSPISRSRKSVSQCRSANPGNGSHPLQQCFIECV